MANNRLSPAAKLLFIGLGFLNCYLLYFFGKDIPISRKAKIETTSVAPKSFEELLDNSEWIGVDSATTDYLRTDTVRKQSGIIDYITVFNKSPYLLSIKDGEAILKTPNNKNFKDLNYLLQEVTNYNIEYKLEGDTPSFDFEIDFNEKDSTMIFDRGLLKSDVSVKYKNDTLFWEMLFTPSSPLKFIRIK
jgi:hypothetical protein